MAEYIITDYTKKKAKKLNLEVRPSKNINKKIDIYKDGVFLFSVGAKGYMDYPSYIKEKGIRYADERRRLYKIRHQNNINKKYSVGWYASELLW